MKRPTGLSLLALMIILIALAGCEKDISITEPIIIIIDRSFPIIVGHEVQVASTVYAYRNSNRMTPESYNWTIEDSLENTVKNDFDNSRMIVWVPEDPGTYKIKVNIKFKYGIKASSESIIVVNENLVLLYVGDYHFKRVINFWTEQGWRNSETKYFDGYVEDHPSQTNTVNIRCGDGAETTLEGWEFTWDEYFPAKLSLDENMQNPSFQIWNDCPHLCFYGRFIGQDSLFIYRDDSGRGGGKSWTYYGSKIK